MTNDIPTGYQINFSTWENDLDVPKVQVWSGIQTVEDVKFLLALANVFVSQYGETAGLGNQSVSTSLLLHVVEGLLRIHTGISPDLRETFNQERDISSEDLGEEEDEKDVLADRWYDLICCRVLGYPEDQNYSDEPRFCRVFEEARIYFFEQPVREISSTFI